MIEAVPVDLLACRGTLTPAQRRLYDVLVRHLLHDELKVRLAYSPVFDEEGIFSTVYHAIVCDYPILFHLSGEYRLGRSRSGDSAEVTFEACTTMGARERRDNLGMLQKELDRLAGRVPVTSDGYEKACYAFDRICGTCSYDSGSGAGRGRTPLGALLDFRAICSGIAGAYCLLLRRLGVPCGCVHDDPRGGVGHRFNIAFIDGAYTYIDATHGWLRRPRPMVGSGRIGHRYLGFSREEIGDSLRLSSGLPDTRSLSDRWFAARGLLFDTRRLGKLDDVLARFVGSEQRSLEVKFTSSQAYERAVGLIDTGMLAKGRFGVSLYRASARGCGRFSSSADPGYRTITFWW